MNEYLRYIQIDCALQIVKDRAAPDEEERKGAQESTRTSDSTGSSSWKIDLGEMGSRLLKAVGGGVITPSTKQGGWSRAPLGAPVKGMVFLPR